MSNKQYASPEPQDIKPLLKEAAERFILPRFRNLQEDEIDMKTGPCDLVTLADIQSEAFLERQLRAMYPKAYVLGEERVSRDNRILGLLNSAQQSYFVVDPVDGTNNFVAGSENFGMLLAYVHKGEVVQAYIYDVLKDKFMTAVKGEGAYADGKRVKFGTQEQKATHGFGKDKYFSDGLKDHFAKRVQESGLTVSILGCSAHEYLQLLENKARFYVACNVKPWDHLGGSLIVREAGGVCKKWDGSDFQPTDLNQSIMSAQNHEDWHALHRTLFQPIVPRPRF